MPRMESDLRTAPARLRAGLNALFATEPDPRTRTLPKARVGQPRTLGALLSAQAGSGLSDPDPDDPPHEARPEVKAGNRRTYVLRRKLEPLACWPYRYAKLPRRAWDDPRLHRGALVSLAVILCTARGRRQFPTYTRSLAADSRVHERTMHNHLKLLEDTGYIITWRRTRRGPLLVRIAHPALVLHRPLPAWVEAGWALQRSSHPKASDALA